MKLLVTGATGFIGREFINKTLSKGVYTIRAAVRKNISDLPVEVDQFNYKGMDYDTDWLTELQDVDCVIHTAARVHIMKDAVNDPLNEFRKINTSGTLNLAQQAANSGVKRFIYLSSIKVNGEATLAESPFTPDDIFVSNDPYALSKYEAEQGLLKLSETTEMEVVIIRPPLVYGSNVKANFLTMMKWLYKGIPLPLGVIHNKRSLVSLDNLVDLIITCIKHPGAANGVFLVSDDEDLSTTELLSRVSNALDKKSCLFPVNQKLLELCLKLMGKKDLALRLCGSLQVDISKTKKLLDWTPPVSVDNGLRKTAEYFLENHT